VTTAALGSRFDVLPARAWIVLPGLALFLGGVALTIWTPTFLTDLAGLLLARHDSIASSKTPAVYVSPLFWGFVGLILAIEALFPADPEQPVLSRGLAIDVVYFPAIMLFRAVLISAYVGFLKSGYDAHLSFLTIGILADLPTAVQLAISILVIDFLGWWNHYLRHRVSILWRFHKVHHSQEQLNLFTNFRNHPLDHVGAVTLVALPMFVTGSTTTEALAFSFFAIIHALLTHANVRWSFGPLGHILVSPQAHRIHHSVLVDHYGRNLGVTFSFWDRLFGTAYAGKEYPAVGLNDPNLPSARDESRGLVQTVALLWAYPFKR
jgi:sterol desaturase/sphingolipid hydroxylase (fatty acid hydroxylase superfamily)